ARGVVVAAVVGTPGKDVYKVHGEPRLERHGHRRCRTPARLCASERSRRRTRMVRDKEQADRASANRPRGLRVVKYISYPLLAERGQLQEIHMGTMSTETWMILAVAVILAVMALTAWLLSHRKQSHRLEQRFGPEYSRTVDNLGSRTKAES